ncbi:MAG: hypothetical protein KAU90_04640 [Sulfurovaceae bacterium]|nr:hypothetical protein [Sulfurovaceae bacterium]
MSALNNLTPEQLAELRAKAKAKLHQQQQAQTQPKQTQTANPNNPNKAHNKGDILAKGAIRANVENRVKEAKRRAKLGIYQAGKERKAIEVEIEESTRMQLAGKYHELEAQKSGYKKADKLKRKYAKKLLEVENEATAYKERLETPLDEYLNLLAIEELEKKERKKKIGFIVKTILTGGYYAYRAGKKEMFLRTGGLNDVD